MAVATDERFNDAEVTTDPVSLVAFALLGLLGVGVTAEERIVALRRAMDQLDLAFTQEFDWFASVTCFRDLGYANAAAWMMEHTGSRRSEAGQRTRDAALLHELPSLEDALSEGATGAEHLKVLSSHVTPERLPLAQRDEQVLVKLAKDLDAEAYRKAVAYWARCCDDELNDPTDADKIAARRKFDLHQLDDGTWNVKGVLEPQTGEALQAALRAIDSKRDPEDKRTPTQRRHDGVDVIAHDFLGRKDRPASHGDRPHVTVTINAETGEAITGGGYRLPEWMRSTSLCDCNVTSVWFDKTGMPFDVGTPKSPIPDRTRRAVIARDQCCRYGGCTMPAIWSDIHHLDHRNNGGANAITNLALFCRFHHRLIHRERLKVSFEPDGTLIATWPHGIITRGPPHHPSQLFN